MIGTLAVDGWTVTFSTARRDLGGLSPFLSVPNVTAHPSITASVPTSDYSMWHYNYLFTLNGYAEFEHKQFGKKRETQITRRN